MPRPPAALFQAKISAQTISPLLYRKWPRHLVSSISAGIQHAPSFFENSTQLVPHAPRGNASIAAPRRDPSERASIAPRKSSAIAKILDAFVENANKNKLPHSADTAHTADTQKPGSFGGQTFSAS